MFINLLTATSYDLDAAGKMQQNPRWLGECDEDYRKRLIATESSRAGGSAFGEFKQAGELAIKAGGITVRDYFAAKALQAMIANTSKVVDLGCSYPDNNLNFAMASYAVADAMLAARGESK